MFWCGIGSDIGSVNDRQNDREQYALLNGRVSHRFGSPKPTRTYDPLYSCCDRNVAGCQFSTVVAPRRCGNQALVTLALLCQREQTQAFHCYECDPSTCRCP